MRSDLINNIAIFNCQTLDEFQYAFFSKQNHNNPHDGTFLWINFNYFNGISCKSKFKYGSKQGLASYFELVRDIYLAFLLFTFFYLMFSYMAYNPEDKLLYDDRVYEIMIEHEKEIHHLWPVNYCTERYLLSTKAKAKYFTYRCKKFVLQYCVVKPVLTIIIIFLHPFHNKLYAQRLMQSFEFIIITSETFSLYYLILFYYALKHPLQPYKPLLKFLIIKVTLFFTFWQSLTLSIFEEEISSCFEPDETKYNNNTIISAIENTLVCIEMLCMTLASICAFTYSDFITQDENKVGTLGQVLTDNWKAFQHDFRLIKPKKFGFISKVHEVEMYQKRISGNQEYEVKLTGDYQRLSKAIDVQYI
ncbi:unnamed protein product [Paramecium sonneborni]|uniref:Uncharacterized protein n=1 Tax=Paramecium sonneborni TaxID=65129 RepID=A0A8S1RNF7_9CILI|nr:unnamed protein product [Paramecium sonneborni]